MAPKACIHLSPLKAVLRAVVFETGQKVQKSSILSFVPTYTQPPIMSTSHTGTPVTINERILAHHYYSKYIFYIRVHSWYCIFFEF